MRNKLYAIAAALTPAALMAQEAGAGAAGDAQFSKVLTDLSSKTQGYVTEILPVVGTILGVLLGLTALIFAFRWIKGRLGR